MRRLKLTTRSSEYKNLRHVVPSLRLQRDVGEVEVVTEAARYIDHLHKTLIERFVLCGIPDSLKDVLGTNDANELCSQHIMNLVSKMAANQRQQQSQANSGFSAAPALDNRGQQQIGSRRRKSQCHRRGPVALEGTSIGANSERGGRRSQLQQHQRARHQILASPSGAAVRQPSVGRISGVARISAHDSLKSNPIRRTNFGKLMSKDCGPNVQRERPMVLVKAKRNPTTIVLPRIQQVPLNFVKSSTTTTTKLPLQITKNGNIEGQGSQLKQAVYYTKNHVSSSSTSTTTTTTIKTIVDSNYSSSSSQESHQNQQQSHILTQDCHHLKQTKSAPLVTDSHCTFSMSPVENSTSSNNSINKNAPANKFSNIEASLASESTELEDTFAGDTEQDPSFGCHHNKHSDLETANERGDQIE